jgi:hypothetical protein
MGMPEPSGSITVTDRVTCVSALAFTGLFLGGWLIFLYLLDRLLGGAIFNGSSKSMTSEPDVLLFGFLAVALSLLTLVTRPLVHAANARILRKSATNSL